MLLESATAAELPTTNNKTATAADTESVLMMFLYTSDEFDARPRTGFPVAGNSRAQRTWDPQGSMASRLSYWAAVRYITGP